METQHFDNSVCQYVSVFIKWQQADGFYFLFDSHLRWTEKWRARYFPPTWCQTDLAKRYNTLVYIFVRRTTLKEEDGNVNKTTEDEHGSNNNGCMRRSLVSAFVASYCVWSCLKKKAGVVLSTDFMNILPIFKL